MTRNVLAICAALWASTALGQTQVTQVSSRDGAVVIAASAPPNFTTFTMDEPPRLVVDLAEATFQGVQADIAVNQGGVRSIKTMPYGAGSNAVARVVITYDTPMQTDIVTNGNSIVVRPAEAVATAPHQATPPAPAPARNEPAQPPSPGQTAAMDDAMSALKSPPPPPETPAPAPAQPEMAAAPPPSPTPAPAPPPPQQAAPQPPPPRPPAEEPIAAAPPETQPRAPHEAPPPEPPPAPAPPPAVAQNEYPPVPPEAAPAPTPAAAPLKVNTQNALASPPPPPPSDEAPHVSGKRKTLSLVGLRFQNGATSVFVRTNEPVNYRVAERPNGLTVTIENTRIRRHNDTRALEAQFFDSPVATVRARQNRGDVEVNIELKNHAAYQATQSGPEVALSFNRG